MTGVGVRATPHVARHDRLHHRGKRERAGLPVGEHHQPRRAGRARAVARDIADRMRAAFRWSNASRRLCIDVRRPGFGVQLRQQLFRDREAGRIHAPTSAGRALRAASPPARSRWAERVALDHVFVEHAADIPHPGLDCPAVVQVGHPQRMSRRAPIGSPGLRIPGP